jgi:dihydroneopterin aldolase
MTGAQTAAQPIGNAADTTSPVRISLRGLSVWGHHGIGEEERTLGQRFEFDVDLEMGDCAACRTDQIADSIPYEEVASIVVEVATRFRFHLMEALAEAVCSELLQEFPIERVALTVHKTAPPIPHALAGASVRVERRRSDG